MSLMIIVFFIFPDRAFIQVITHRTNHRIHARFVAKEKLGRAQITSSAMNRTSPCFA